MKQIAVVALGGNALIKRGEQLSAAVQIKNAALAAEKIIELHETHRVVIVHGNGPQVGLLAIQNDACTISQGYPFDILVAETQGMVGHIISQEIVKAKPYTKVSTVLTHVIVNEKDEAFANPSKPIGPMYNEEEVTRLKSKTDWVIKKDGNGYRRVVSSPTPERIIEMQTITSLLEKDHIVIASGGGGIPVTMKDGSWTGVEAVIDKDLSASFLAEQLGAEALIILTDGDGVFDNFGEPNQKKLDDVSLADLAIREFDAGTMGPKIKAVTRFVENTGQMAAIGDLSKGPLSIVTKQSGTRIYKELP